MLQKNVIKQEKRHKSKCLTSSVPEELQVGNNIFIVCYSHNEKIIIGIMVIFLQQSTGVWYTYSKIKRLDISF